MDVQTEEETPLADVVTALSAQAALTTRDRRPHGDDFPEKVGVGVRPNGQNTPTNLVTENERRHTHPRVARVSVQIRAAEAARFDPDERFASLWLWLRKVLDAKVARASVDERLHSPFAAPETRPRTKKRWPKM